jgi:hypothetical protein
MITELVFIDLPKGITREEVMAKYRQTAAAWSRNEDLVHKFYFFDAAKSQGGGVYIWKTRDAAYRWHGEEYRSRIRALYGSEPRMSCFDTLLVIDNVLKQVSEPPGASHRDP